jgi:hypothetical protein
LIFPLTTTNAFGLVTFGNAVYWQFNGSNFTGGGTVSLNTWSHIAVVRSSSVTKIYLNGAQVASIADTNNYTGTPTRTIGSNGGTNSPLYMSNVRIVKGTAVYTTAFTPPTAALTNITNTTLLTAQSNKFIDNSSSPNTLTLVGSPQIQPASPFFALGAYTNTNVGGSMYFNGSTDYVNTAIISSLTPNYGDYTVEYWVYMTSTARGDHFYLAGGTTRIIVYYSGTAWAYLENSTSRISSTNNNNTYGWHHIAVSRASNTVSMYVDGSRIGTYSSAYNLSDSNYYIQLGKDTAGST